MRSVGKFFILAATSSLALACSADAPSGPDARPGSSADARTGSGFPDASSLRPDARPFGSPDAMGQVQCEGADTEPNDVQLSAEALPTTNECDYDSKDPEVGEGGSIAGSVISGNEDWFSFQAEDTFSIFCEVGPNVTLVGNVRVCMLLLCNEGDTELTCPAGTTDVGGGQLGCCGEAGFEVEDYNCTGTTDEDSQVYVQVTALSTDTCEAYTVDYSF